MPFHNRVDAGRQLAGRLERPPGEPVVIGLPRGGVPVAAEIARAWGAPLDMLLVRKLGAPGQPELAAGAVVEGVAEPVLNPDIIHALHIPPGVLAEEVARQRAEIARRRQAWRGDAAPPRFTGRTLVLVDDGAATGATMKAALRGLHQSRAAWLVVALPVAPPGVAAGLAGLCDEAVVLETPASFHAVGQFYEDFRQTSEAEMLGLLRGG